MKELSAALLLAWQMAVIETGFMKHQFIEKEQIIIGICSLEKVLISRKFNTRDKEELKLENESIEAFLSKFKLTPTCLRREIRKRYGKGNFKHIEKIIHRSENCKELFNRAEILTEKSESIRCLHLFAAILESPEGIIKEFLKERGIDHSEMLKKALFFARIYQKKKNNDSYII